MRANHLITAAGLLSGACVALAGDPYPVSVTLDEEVSSATAELCVDAPVIGEECDQDTSSLSGYADIGIDDPAAPTEITLTDFQFVLDDGIDLVIDYGFFGQLDVTVEAGSTVQYATPGLPLTGPVEADGSFSIANVPVLMTGMAEYTATDTVCDIIQDNGLPCSDSINLADVGAVTVDSFSGDIAIDGDTLTMTSEVSTQIPLDPKNPDFGTLTIDAFAQGSGVIEEPPDTCPADIDGNGTVDSIDLNIILGDFGCMEGEDVECPGNIDGDGDTDSMDLNIVLGSFGSDCD